MSCHDWAALVAHRSDPVLPVPVAWPDALDHLESCAECKREALSLDPTLALRDAARWVPSSGDIEGIRLGVETLRRTGELASAKPTGRSRSRTPRGHGRVASALLFATVLALQADSTARTSMDLPEAGVVAFDDRAQQSLGPVAPAIDGLDRPLARIYEWGADDLSVVMVVDETLDV